MKIKIISIFVITLLISSIVAVGSYNENEPLSLSEDIEISIYETLYMRKNKSYEETEGLLILFKNNAQRSFNIHLGLHLKTYSTKYWDYFYKTDKNYTLSIGGIRGLTFSTDFGIGFFKI